MTPRPPLRAGQGNRRRRPPAQAAARRHARWLLNRVRQGGLVLRQLPAQIRGRMDWRRSVAQAGQAVADGGRALAPVAQRAFAGFGKGLDRSAAGLGRSAAASGRGLRSLSQLSARALARLATATRSGALASARAARWLARQIAVLVARGSAFLWQRRAVLRAFAARGAWWAALALLWFGGRAVLDFRGPLAEDALPLFLVGLGLCLPLFFAAAARLRWAAFALGTGHAALAVAVWTITTSG